MHFDYHWNNVRLMQKNKKLVYSDVRSHSSHNLVLKEFNRRLGPNAHANIVGQFKRCLLI